MIAVIHYGFAGGQLVWGIAITLMLVVIAIFVRAIKRSEDARAFVIVLGLGLTGWSLFQLMGSMADRGEEMAVRHDVDELVVGVNTTANTVIILLHGNELIRYRYTWDPNQGRYQLDYFSAHIVREPVKMPQSGVIDPWMQVPTPTDPSSGLPLGPATPDPTQPTEPTTTLI